MKTNNKGYFKAPMGLCSPAGFGRRRLISGISQYYKHKPVLFIVTASSILCIGFVYTLVGLSLHHPYADYFHKQLHDTDNVYKNASISLIGKITLNLNRTSVRIWKDSDTESHCANFETRFGVNISRVSLVSFPCSGNTWTRYLLEGATGVFTGSFYNDKTLYEQGMLGEYEMVENRTTLTQKTHGLAIYRPRQTEIIDSLDRQNMIDPDIPTILLLRNPMKAIISYWKFRENNRKEDAHTAQLPLESFQSDEFHVFVKRVIYLWEQLAMDVLMWTKAPLHILHYEHLQQNTTHYLRLLLAFLGIPVDEQRMKCLYWHLDGSFKRKHSVKLDPFSLEEKRRMSSSVRTIHQLIKLKGYADPPVYDILQS